MKFRNVRTAVTYFFFQAEDGIRDLTVTGVQTCALPISTRSRTSAARSWRISPAPTPTSSGSPSRRHAVSSRSSAYPSVSLPGRDRLLKGLQVKHLLGARDPRGCGQGRVGADDPDRLLKLLGRDEPVGEIARARGLEPKRELVRGAYRTAREPRRELLGAGLTDPLLGGEQRAGERREVGVRRAPVCANEDGGAHGLHAEGLGDRLGGAEIGEQRRAALLEEARGHRLRDERGVDLARVDRAEETTPPQAHEMELGDADADASQQPAEPGELGSARCRHADAEPPEALDGPYGARMPGGDEHRERRGGGQAEHEAGRLAGSARTEAQQRL